MLLTTRGIADTNHIIALSVDLFHYSSVHSKISRGDIRVCEQAFPIIQNILQFTFQASEGIPAESSPGMNRVKRPSVSLLTFVKSIAVLSWSFDCLCRSISVDSAQVFRGCLSRRAGLSTSRTDPTGLKITS